MYQSTMHVGLDVHKETIDVALAPTGQGEIRSLGRIAGDLDSVDKILGKLRRLHPGLSVAYEAGPCGYALYRHLKRKGIPCVVVAPSLIPKHPGDRIKTDRRDAVSLARLLRAGELTPVFVPEPEDEAIRDLSRSREDAVEANRRARQQLGALLLRHNIRYPGAKAWTLAHQRVERITEQMRLSVAEWRMGPVVEAFQALRGVSLVAAATLVAELGDVTRFDKPRQLMAFLGLVPSQYSSGPHHRFGHITKTGNSHARRMLVESAWAYRFPARISRNQRSRQEGQAQGVQDIAWKAQLRLCRKYRAMAARGKSKQVVVTAIARELSGFLWAIAREVKKTAA
jgi:transposase